MTDFWPWRKSEWKAYGRVVRTLDEGEDEVCTAATPEVAHYIAEIQNLRVSEFVLMTPQEYETLLNEREKEKTE